MAIRTSSRKALMIGAFLLLGGIAGCRFSDLQLRIKEGRLSRKQIPEIQDDLPASPEAVSNIESKN